MTKNVLPTIAIDEGDDSDWIKARTWDLPTAVGPFLNAIGAGDPKVDIAERRRAVSRFMGLPAARMMPESLRSSLKRAGVLQ